MPTPERPVLPDHPTKHQLDELDALMERMLSLPVNDLDEAPSLPKESVKGPTLAASLTLLEPPEPSANPPVSHAAPKPEHFGSRLLVGRAGHCRPRGGGP